MTKRYSLTLATACVALALVGVAIVSHQRDEKDAPPGAANRLPVMPGPVVPMRKLELIESRTFNKPIKLRALARNGMVLMTTASLHPEIKHVIDGHRAHLIGLSSESLKWAGGFTMPGKQKWFWSGGMLLVSPTVNRVLFHNQYIDLDTWTCSTVLPYVPVSGMKNVVPEPLDISPNGKAALVRLRSLSKRDLDTTVLYDLESGAIKLKLPARKDLTGNHQALHRLRNDPTPDSAKNRTRTACFLSDNAVALMNLDGTLDVLNTDTNRRERIIAKPLGDASYRHLAQLMPIRGSTYLVCWIYGRDGMAVVDWEKKTLLHQTDAPLQPPVHSKGTLLYPARSAWKQAEGLCPHMKNAPIGQSVLALRDIATGRLLMEYEWGEDRESLLLDAQKGILWAAGGTTLFKYRIDLTLPSGNTALKKIRAAEQKDK